MPAAIINPVDYLSPSRLDAPLIPEAGPRRSSACKSGRDRGLSTTEVIFNVPAEQRGSFRAMAPWLFLAAMLGYTAGWLQWSGVMAGVREKGSVIADIASVIVPGAAFFAFAANFFNIFFYLSPIVQMVQVYKTGGAELENVSSQTLTLMLFNCSMWAIFGIYGPMPACVPGNVVGGVAAVCYLVFCWTQVALKRISTPRWGFNAAIGNVVAVGIILFFVSYAKQSHENGQQVGFLAAFCCIAMFASPLSDLGEVIRTRNSKLLPPAQCLMQFMMTLMWLVVGVNAMSMQIIMCNGLGLLLGGAQLGVIAMFPARDNEDGKEESA